MNLLNTWAGKGPSRSWRQLPALLLLIGAIGCGGDPTSKGDVDAAAVSPGSDSGVEAVADAGNAQPTADAGATAPKRTSTALASGGRTQTTGNFRVVSRVGQVGGFHGGLQRSGRFTITNSVATVGK